MARRRAFKLSLAAFVAVTVVWIASWWVGAYFSTGTTAFGIGRGIVTGEHGGGSSGLPPTGFHYFALHGYTPILLPKFKRSPGDTVVAVPLWIPALLAGG